MSASETADISEAEDSYYQPIINWAKTFNDLSMRERVLVSAGLVAIVWAIWFFLIHPIFLASLTSAERQLELAKSTNVSNTRLRDELRLIAERDPNVPVKQALAAARADFVTMDAHLQTSLSQFIAPRSMTLVLRDLVAEQKNLQLTRLNRLPARNLLPKEEQANLYLHPMKLQLEGKYLEVLDYVGSLESGDWQFNWQTFEYKTKDYPNGVATIEIETLSREEYWLGL